MRPPQPVVMRVQGRSEQALLLLSVCRGLPSPAKKHVGRPTRLEAWVERVQRALRADERDGRKLGSIS